MEREYPKLTNILRYKLMQQLKSKYIIDEKEYLLFPNKKQISFKADIKIRKKDSEKKLNFIEVEETQGNPDTNVSKYWMLLDEQKDISIKLIQIIGREYVKTERNYQSIKE